MSTSPPHAQVAETIRRTHDVGAEFLIADLELALVLLDRAVLSRDADACARNLKNGRNALRTVDGFLTELDLDERQRTKIRILRQELEQSLRMLSS
jgi:hypothetical protein